MLNPPLEALLDKADSRYTLVVAAAKRARQLMEDKKKLIDLMSKKPVSVALQEIYEGKVKLQIPPRDRREKQKEPSGDEG